MSDDDEPPFVDIPTFLRNQPPTIPSIEKVRWYVNDMWERNKRRGLTEGINEYEWKECVFKSQMAYRDEDIARLAKMNEKKEKEKESDND